MTQLEEPFLEIDFWKIPKAATGGSVDFISKSVGFVQKLVVAKNCCNDVSGGFGIWKIYENLETCQLVR